VLSVTAALIIFIITYPFIGLRQIPLVHIDRTAGALVGAVLMIVFGVLTLDQAFVAIDMNTLLRSIGGQLGDPNRLFSTAPSTLSTCG
jgi:Na+/H+ antiporter NhaD/arsenite permease-like protein